MKTEQSELVDYDVREPSITQKMRGRAITGAEAMASAHRLINSHFRNPDRARCSIPAQVTDDDIVVIDFIREHMAASTPEAAGRSDEDRWIPCTERLPKQETPVLIVLRECVRIGERRWEHPTHEESFRAFWYWDDPENDGQDWNTLDVTSWRPLPAPDSGEQAAAPEKEN